MKKIIWVLLLILSCGAQQVKDYVSVEDDKFKKTKVFKGIESRLDASGSKLFLRSFYNYQNKMVSHQAYVVVYYHYNWRFYHSAFDSDGKQYEFIPIDDSVFCRRGCTFTEHFAIKLENADLKKENITFKVYAKKYEPMIFSLTNDMIHAQLDAIQNAL